MHQATRVTRGWVMYGKCHLSRHSENKKILCTETCTEGLTFYHENERFVDTSERHIGLQGLNDIDKWIYNMSSFKMTNTVCHLSVNNQWPPFIYVPWHVWHCVYRASYCNVLITNEMHNSYNQFLFHSLSALHVANDSSRSSSAARHNILYYTVWCNRYRRADSTIVPKEQLSVTSCWLMHWSVSRTEAHNHSDATLSSNDSG